MNLNSPLSYKVTFTVTRAEGEALGGSSFCLLHRIRILKIKLEYCFTIENYEDGGEKWESLYTVLTGWLLWYFDGYIRLLQRSLPLGSVANLT